jgi:hypothetical protein
MLRFPGVVGLEVLEAVGTSRQSKWLSTDYAMAMCPLPGAARSAITDAVSSSTPV